MEFGKGGVEEGSQESESRSQEVIGRGKAGTDSDALITDYLEVMARPARQNAHTPPSDSWVLAPGSSKPPFLVKSFTNYLP